MMATSEVSVSLTVAREAAIEPVLEEMRGFADVGVLDGCAIVCVVGEGLRETPGVAARVFRALGEASVNVLMISQGASRLNLGLVVEAKDAEPAVRTLHAIFFEAERKR
jgi:aspartate kinase